jgi:NAD(P)-dependent dehydrogenase (short-subunit alcohol dehydrogenase family)
MQLDVSSKASIDALAANLERSFPALDVLINNAACAPSVRQVRVCVQHVCACLCMHLCVNCGTMVTMIRTKTCRGCLCGPCVCTCVYMG